MKRLNSIGRLKQLGLSLEEIGEVISIYFEDATRLIGKRKILEILLNHCAETDRKLAELNQFRDELLQNIARIQLSIAMLESGKPEPGSSSAKESGDPPMSE